MTAMFLSLAALAALALWLAVPLLAPKLLYKPERGPHDLRKPEFPADVRHQDLRVSTIDGETLHGWLVQGEGNRGVLLICHGNRGSIANREDTALFYLSLGIDVCLFDYRGYGQSTGRPSEAGTYSDVDAMWSHLTRKCGYAPQDVALLGRSLGAAVAAHLAATTTPAAVILESTFSSLAALAKELYPRIYRLLRTRDTYNTLSKMPRIQSPLLLVHSADDELIGLHHGKALQAAAAPGTRLLEIHGRHRDGFVSSRDVYLPAIRAFLDAHVSSRQHN